MTLIYSKTNKTEEASCLGLAVSRMWMIPGFLSLNGHFLYSEVKSHPIWNDFSPHLSS